MLLLVTITTLAIVPADLEIVVQARAEANFIWLCRAQPTINKINLPVRSIKICNLITTYFTKMTLFSKVIFFFYHINYF